jgi:hypothetical protein
MGSAKRLIVASLSGLLFGFVCYGFASGGPEELAWPVAIQIIASRTLIGVAIGLSRFSFGHWAIHGLLIGLVFSLPLGFSGYMAPESLDFSKDAMFIWTVVLGMIYGLLIELITSVVFKARLLKPTAV